MENSIIYKPREIAGYIISVRSVQIILDRDIAKLYGVSTGNLNKAVKRNLERFPKRYMFQLTSEENLKFQNGISSWGGSRSLPYVFTEQGVAMSSIISAELEAIKAKLELLERNDEDNLEAINDLSEDMRQEIDTIYQAIAALSVKEPTNPEPQRKKIGFKTSAD